MKIVVLHKLFGCETGCCGHVVERDGEQVGAFEFIHPTTGRDDFKKWAEELVARQCGEEHVKDLDWENSVIVDD